MRKNETKTLVAVLTGCLLMFLSGCSEVSIIFRITGLIYGDTLNQMPLSRFLLMAPVGGIVGCYIFCLLAELFGRKYALAALSLPIIISQIIFTVSNTFTWICIGQVICGLTSGGSMAIIPVYLGEICDKTTRGQTLAFLYVSLKLGHSILRTTLAAINEANITFIIQYAIIAIYLLAAAIALTIMESPYYKFRKVGISTTGLAEQNVKIGRSNQDPNINGIRKQFNVFGWLKLVLLVAVAFISTYLSGIYIMELTVAITMSHLPLSNIIQTVIQVVPNLVGAFACPFLVDRIGRRFCFMISYAGVAIALSAIRLLIYLRRSEDDTLCNSLIVLVTSIFNISYHFGAGPIPFVLLGEILPVKMKMLSSALCCGLCYVVSCLIILLELELTSDIWLYIDICFCASFVVAVYLLYSETRKKNLEEIQTILKVT